MSRVGKWVRTASRLVRRAIRRAFHTVVSTPLSLEASEFVRRNAEFWSAYWPDGRRAEARDHVLVRDEGHSIISLCNTSFAAIIGQARGLKILVVTRVPRRDIGPQIVASYPNATFVNPSRLRHPAMAIMGLVEAVKAYWTIKTPQEVLTFQVDGIRFGDAIYDAVLAGGFATIPVVDRRVLSVLGQFFFLRAFVRYLIKRYRIETSVSAHNTGLEASVFSRYLLHHGIEVINRVGAHQILLRKNRKVSDVWFYPVKPEPKYFRLMMEKDDGTILKRAEEYMNHRFDQEIAHPAVELAFNTSKRTFADRESFCAAYDLDSRKPLVFVMLHAFNDYPHSHFARPMIYQDYYVWFRRTLAIARGVKSVNWVFKEHPAAAHYVTKDVDIREIFQTIRSEHIRLLSADADFNARSLRYLAHAIVTCIGTAGLEYATQGIPCILGGESGYSGFGFTIEPRDVSEYEECLRGIAGLPRLNPEQIRAAKIVAYFYFRVLITVRYHFCPYFDDNELAEWSAEMDDRLWEEAAAQFHDAEHVRQMREQVQELSRFVLDPSWTQYVDLHQHPFLDEHLHTADLGSQTVENTAGRG
jgi:hypothetical protein